MILRALLCFWLASKARLKLTYPHPWQLLKRNTNAITTVSCAVNRDQSRTSYIRRLHHFLKAKATDTIKPSFMSFISHQGAGKALVFVEEKKSPVDAEVNRKNYRILAYDHSDVQPVFQTKNLASDYIRCRCAW